MKVRVTKGKMDQIEDGVIILSHFEKERLSGVVKAIDDRLSGMIGHLLEDKDFEGRLNQTAIIYTQGKLPTPRIILVGLGKKAEFNLDKLRQAFASACRRVKELKLNSFTAMLPSKIPKGIDLKETAQSMVEGIFLSNYQLDKFKTTEKEEVLESFTLVEEDERRIGALEQGAHFGEIFSWATNYTRDLANQPSNILTPTALSLEAKRLAQEYNLRCKILSLPEIKKLKMNSFLAVASGSKEPAKLIILEYHHQGRQAKDKKSNTLALVGKGITFDAGGLSLKPTDDMLEMKGDMAGGAVVMSAIAASARLGLPLNLIGIIPATENLPSGSALKIGDIVTSHSGKTIEILNTDAEGRLILADALSYAKTFKPDTILDVATLTSGVKLALGNICAGVLGNHEKLKSKMIRAGQKTGERVWELPLWDDYQEFIKSDLADVKNTGGKWGAAIIATRFLQNFIGDYPWVHVDIAGVAFSEKERPYIPLSEKDRLYIPKGATGFGARLLLQFLRDWDGV